MIEEAINLQNFFKIYNFTIHLHNYLKLTTYFLHTFFYIYPFIKKQSIDWKRIAQTRIQLEKKKKKEEKEERKSNNVKLYNDSTTIN